MSIARQIWEWCEKRNNFIFASYIASGDNIIADLESRTISEDTEWSFSQKAFARLSNKFGPPEIDHRLFASIINAKCTMYSSWFPDPGSLAVDAFTFSWTHLNFYAFPPFILLPRVLRKILTDRGEGIVVVPWWPSQPWFPLFQRLLVGDPLILSPSYNLLSSPSRNCHPTWRTFSLGVGKLSGKPF